PHRWGQAIPHLTDRGAAPGTYPHRPSFLSTPSETPEHCCVGSTRTLRTGPKRLPNVRRAAPRDAGASLRDRSLGRGCVLYSLRDLTQLRCRCIHRIDASVAASFASPATSSTRTTVRVVLFTNAKGNEK